MKKRYQIQVSGKVQGVYFRASTKEKAIALGLSGFVRNEPNGSVYIEAEGEAEPLKNFINWCHHGPSAARVERVNIQEVDVKSDHTFEIRR